MPQAMPPNLDELYRRLAPRLLMLGYQLTGNRAAAEDVLQEAFVSAHRFLAGFRGEANPETWLYRITIRAASRHRARVRREHATLQGRAGGFTTGPHTNDEGEELLLALASLPEEQRLVLTLLTQRDLSSGQVAEILGIPEGTVWSRASSARRLMRSFLESRHEATRTKPSARSVESGESPG